MKIYLPIVIEFDYSREIGRAVSDPDGYGDLVIKMSPLLDFEKLKTLQFRVGVLIDVDERSVKRVAVKSLSVDAGDYLA